MPVRVFPKRVMVSVSGRGMERWGIGRALGSQTIFLLAIVQVPRGGCLELLHAC
jgi:hypothetical protein